MTSWFEARAEKEAKRDRIKWSERISGLIGVAISIFVLWYFAVELANKTGFFIPTFGTGDQVLFFGSMIVGMASPVARFILGRRNVVRILDIITTAFFIVVLLWFLSTFPFDFTHLADSLPESMRFILSWISNDLVKALMVIGIIGSGIMIVYTAFLYRAVRKRLRAGVANA